MKTTFDVVCGLTLASAMALGACSPRDKTPARDSLAASTPAPPAASGDSAGRAGGMQNMQGMNSMGGVGMMDSMHTRMQRMEGMSPDQMKAMLPAHRQMAGNMLSQMSSEMRSMNTPATPAWTATADSVRQDLVNLPDLGVQELTNAMASHRARLMRLMQMHRDMMKNMKM